MKEVKHYKTKILPARPIPDSIIYVKADGDTKVTTYITDINGVPYLLKDDVDSDYGVQTIYNTDGSIIVAGVDNIRISLSSVLQAMIANAIPTGANISTLVNDVGYITATELSTTITITKKAGENISTGMAVVIGSNEFIYKYDITNINHAGLSCGITKTSAITGGDITIVTPENILTDVGSGWSAGNSYFVGINSLLTTIPPTSGINKKIATGIGVDTILINNYPEHILL
jgi:hypothetical protein